MCSTLWKQRRNWTHQPASTHNWHSRGRREEEEGRQKRGSSLLHITPSAVNNRALPFSQAAYYNLSHCLSITSTQHPLNRIADPRLQLQETSHCLLRVRCAQLPWQCSSLLLKNNHHIYMKMQINIKLQPQMKTAWSQHRNTEFLAVPDKRFEDTTEKVLLWKITLSSNTAYQQYNLQGMDTAWKQQGSPSPVQGAGSQGGTLAQRWGTSVKVPGDTIARCWQNLCWSQALGTRRATYTEQNTAFLCTKHGLWLFIKFTWII